MEKMAKGLVAPTIDSVIRIEEIDKALARLEARDVFGKIVVTL